jgi:hypothetical protein
LSRPRRRLRPVLDPPEPQPKTEARHGGATRQNLKPTPSRGKRLAAAAPGQSAAPAEDATSLAPKRRTARPRAIPAKRGRVRALAAVADGKTLGVRPARLVPASEETWAQARRALTVLYRDFLAGGGLDVLTDRRSHARPANDAQEREAA